MGKKQKTIPLALMGSYRKAGELGSDAELRQEQEDRFFNSHDPRTTHEEVCVEMMLCNYQRMVETVQLAASLRTGDPVKDFELAIKSERHISSIQRSYLRSAKALLDAQKHRRIEERADQLLETQLEHEAEIHAHNQKIAQEIHDLNEKRSQVLDVIIVDAPTLTDHQMMKNACNAYYVKLMEDLGFVPHKYKKGLQ